MSTQLLPQRYCRDLTDHAAHLHRVAGHLSRCPGRHTPSNYRASRPSPSVPTDPFAGIDESE